MPATEWGWLVTPEELRSWIVQENEEVLLLNKPALVVCHPSKRGPWSSLAGACRECFALDHSRLVSRLDRETSGAVLFAKSRRAARAHQMALQERLVQKVYFGILQGELAEPLLVDEPLARDKESLVHSKSRVWHGGRRQEAQTRFAPLLARRGYTIARIEPLTGRKHQIRVHARHIGHPLAGDKLYGPDEALFLEFVERGWTERLAQALPLPRHALHACRMAFRLPDAAEPVVYRTPPTADLETFCRERLGLSEEEWRAALQALLF